MDFSKFLVINNIKSKDVANYLQVGEPTVSKYLSNKAKPSKKTLYKLCNNPFGWDTTMLEDGGSINATTTAGRDATVSIRNSYGETGKIRETNARLSAENEMLREKIQEQNAIIAELKSEKEKYWELIQKLMK